MATTGSLILSKRCRSPGSRVSTSRSSKRAGAVTMTLEHELPDDVIVDVLRHLPPRSLAVSRCVCRAWREAIDANWLLHADLLPLSLRGIFINYISLGYPEFFSRPTTGPAIWGDLDFVPHFWKVDGHCNGLLHSFTGEHDYVANPATRQGARLPPRPSPTLLRSSTGMMPSHETACLLYDPAVSPHYEMFLILALLEDPESRLYLEILQSEWPQSSLAMQVFSSHTGRWEERLFVREGRAAGAMENKEGRTSKNNYAVYWRGVLYVHLKNDFVIRLSMSDAKYKLVPMPVVEFDHFGSFHLGRSEKGVYCTYTHDWHGIKIFHLDESSGQAEWVLLHCVDLRALARKLDEREAGERNSGPWILQNINDYKYSHEGNKTRVVEEKFEWDSDNDDVLDTEDVIEGQCGGYIDLLGFHPYKEVIFLGASLRRGIAYHWNTSKFQDLGDIFPTDYAMIAGHVAEIDNSFPYTPCWMMLPESSWDANDIED